MAEFSTDSAAASYSEDAATSGHEFWGRDLPNPLQDASQVSAGYDGVYDSILQYDQGYDSTNHAARGVEDFQINSPEVEEKRYVALTPDGSTDGCVGSPVSLGPSSSCVTCSQPETEVKDSLTEGIWTYSADSGLQYLTHSQDTCVGHDGTLADYAPQPYYPYWGDEHEDRDAEPPSSNFCLDALLTPSPSPASEFRSRYGHDFLETVKACVACAVRLVVLKKMKKECYGCDVAHPSQRNHSCLFPPNPGYFELNFEHLLNDLLTWEFLPALKSTLEEIGLDTDEGRVEGAAHAFLHDLKPEDDILTKVGDIIERYQAQGIEREPLLDHFINFWNP